MFDKAKAGVLDTRVEFEVITRLVISYPNVKLFYVNKSYNEEAVKLQSMR